MKVKQFKIRSSAIHSIMTQPKTKTARENGELSQTTKSYCELWLKEQLYSRKKEFTNKYTEKGNICEDNSLDFIASQLDLGFLFKNEDYFENEYLTGTPDVNMNFLIDVKNSWDCFTFPLFDDKIDPKYYAQGQGYMDLTGKNEYKLIYVLSDTPEHLINREAYYFAKNNGFDEIDEDIYSEIKKYMTYSDVPDNLKIKIFEFKKDEDYIKSVYEQVKKCRKYINGLLLRLK